MFKKIIRFFFQKRINKHIKEDEREHRFVNYDNARTIMLLFESDYIEKNSEIRRIIQNLNADGKKVMTWGYINKKEVATAILPDFRILHQKDTDLLQKPHESFMRELGEARFDLLIDLSVNEVIPLQYLTLYANAACKVGIKKNDFQIYDFLIDMESISSQTEESFIEIDAAFIYNQIIFYLKSIQTSD
ncbi:MAG: hypothetical protein LLF95_08890 [Bacteroidales bacterium]|nr:hypothetical protein [Bacteroidales bacterium]